MLTLSSYFRNQDAPRLPPPPGPSKTFTIDFQMSPPDDAANDLEALAERHEKYIDEFLPPDPTPSSSSSGAIFGSAGQYSTPTGGPLTPPASAPSPAPARSIQSLGLKPQFNLDSAETLLSAFQGMLFHFPCIILPQDVSVSKLAKSSPFVLLSILAASSGSRNLQGHSLYDEEFRKILALKFVASGERSLELLQGLLIYVAW
jgi:hypothetical protein